MASKKILIVSGTHGNEINSIWAVKKYRSSIDLSIQNNRFEFVEGNPSAIKKGIRYVDLDLNRSFKNNKLGFDRELYEFQRAEFLIKEYGISGFNPCQIAIDLHTTTASMGSSIVMYGRRKFDFCLAAILQNKFGLPIYLHEKDKNQTGFLVEAWPCGLVIEIGPVAQNQYDPEIINRFLIILEFLQKMDFNIDNLQLTSFSEITVHVHKKSIDYPRDKDNRIEAIIHPLRVNQDWKIIHQGDPLFLSNQGKTIEYIDEDNVYPVFIGEASYIEKNIAMSFTKKEIIQIPETWLSSFLSSSLITS